MNKDIITHQVRDIAYLGGAPLFNNPKPTSNLVRPDMQSFFGYLNRIDIKSSQLIYELENRLALLHEASYCISMNSGFWALALLIDSLRLPMRNEVILPSLTYRKMGDIISWCGLVPHFCDIERTTLANSANTVLPCVNKNTALIIGVHPVGGHCDVTGLMDLADAHGIPLIFDSVESVNELYQGVRIGCFGAAELFSLGASKLINGFEGGYVTTNNADLADRLRLKRCGKGDGLTISSELPVFHAAMALAGLDELASQIMRNQARFDRYRRELAVVPELRLVEQAIETEPSHKNIVVEVLEDWPYTRNETVSLLNAENIFARAYYAPPLTHKPIAYEYISSQLPNTDWAAERFISMPCGHLVNLDDISGIVGFLRFLRENSRTILSEIRQ